MLKNRITEFICAIAAAATIISSCSTAKLNDNNSYLELKLPEQNLTQQQNSNETKYVPAAAPKSARNSSNYLLIKDLTIENKMTPSILEYYYEKNSDRAALSPGIRRSYFMRGVGYEDNSNLRLSTREILKYLNMEKLLIVPNKFYFYQDTAIKAGINLRFLNLNDIIDSLSSNREDRNDYKILERADLTLSINF